MRSWRKWLCGAFGLVLATVTLPLALPVWLFGITYIFASEAGDE